MKILYVSSLCSERLNKDLFDRGIGVFNFAAQKFHRLVTKGLAKNGADVCALSSIFLTKKARKICSFPEEYEGGVFFKYIPSINFFIFRHICLFVYSFFYTFFWGLKRRNEKTAIIDIQQISICMGSLLACKFIGLKNVGVVMDLPGLMITDNAKCSFVKKKIKKISSLICKMYLKSFSAYVFLTEAMNDVVNIYNRPYMIMEGLVDSDCAVVKNELANKAKEKVVLYAGGLFEQYGMDILVRAFMKLSLPDARLVLYGSGTYVEKIKKYAKEDSRIVYRGVRSNEDVVKDEISATLLVNPRPTYETFTKYSFPSKNMEYMVSGTPLLTTRLPGMPQEYYPYVYMFDEETIDGFAKSLGKVLSSSPDQLCQKGKDAQNFVLAYKNNVIQGHRIIEFVKNSL